MIGDASGTGFGSAWVEGLGEPDGGKVVWEYGMWSDEGGNESSNWREADNLIKLFEEDVNDGSAVVAEIFLLTDNIIFEGCYYKGYSQSETLCALILRLHVAAQEGELNLHVIHIAGTRMKASGVDGLSQGDLVEGILKGDDPLKFIPLNELDLDRDEGRLEAWIDTW